MNSKYKQQKNRTSSSTVHQLHSYVIICENSCTLVVLYIHEDERYVPYITQEERNEPKLAQNIERYKRRLNLRENDRSTNP